MLGVIDADKIPEVERYIQASPEVRALYEELQENIALLAKKLAIMPPDRTKERILSEIDELEPTSTTTFTYQLWWAIAASLAALVFCVWSLLLTKQRTSLQNDLNKLRNQYTTLKDRCNERQEQWMLLADAQTERFLLKGNEKASQLETIAYWNEEQETSYLRILALPDLPPTQCLQLWADVDGEMVSLSIIPNEVGQLVDIPFKKEATSLNVTIEPAGGSEHPTVADLVASVSI